MTVMTFAIGAFCLDPDTFFKIGAPSLRPAKIVRKMI